MNAPTVTRLCHTLVATDTRLLAPGEPQPVYSLIVTLGLGHYVTDQHFDPADSVFSVLHGSLSFIIGDAPAWRCIHRTLSPLLHAGGVAPTEVRPELEVGKHDATMWPGTPPVDIKSGEPLFGKCTRLRLGPGDHLHVPRHVVHAVVTTGPRMAVSIYSDVGMDKVASDTTDLTEE